VLGAPHTATLGRMNAANSQTLGFRLLLFLLLPVTLWWGTWLIGSLSILLIRDLFFPFVSHPHLFAQGPWLHLANATSVAIVAIVSALVGRRFSIWANSGLFLGVAIVASVAIHLALEMLGYPFEGDAP
jgi:hypothetical protein